jgi:hypothetical protein
LHADCIGQPHGRDARAERAIDPITSVSQHDPGRDPGRQRGSDLIERDPRLGLEGHIVRDMSFLAPRRVIGPIFRQIQPVGDRQTSRVIGDRQRHRDLAIILLAEPPAVLPRNAYRMNPLLRKACIIDDPGLDSALRLDRRQNELTHFGQNRFVRPSRLTYQMQQRLMLRRDLTGRHSRRHGLHALALARHQQASAIISERPRSIVTTKNSR